MLEIGTFECGTANFIPEDPPPSGYVINSDGTFSGEKLRRDGAIYTLTGDINCPIVIHRDGIVLDGSGYTLRGSGDSSGIWVQERSNLVIKNFNIQNFQFGIKFTILYGTSNNNNNCSVQSCTVTNNSYGICFFRSQDCQITNNRIADNTYGVWASHGSDVYRNNCFEANQYAFHDEYGGNDMDTSNTVNGKPAYYWYDKHDLTVPSNAGLVILIHCSNIKVENLNLKGNGNGVLLVDTTDSIITKNMISQNTIGINLQQSHNNQINNNHITNNKEHGINQYDSHDNQITNNIITGNNYGISSSYTHGEEILNNQITDNTADGINADSQSGVDCLVKDNTVSGNGGNGIFFKDIHNAQIISNTITQNKGCGVGFGYGPGGLVRGNIISKNGNGLWISNAYQNTIISNDVSENEGLSIRLEGSQHDNILYHNNFINNNHGQPQAFITTTIVYPENYLYDETHRPRHVDGAANNWDNGNEGNYWSDYNTLYPDATKSGNTANTPYYINVNNQDNHPLLSPHKISSTEESSISPSLTTATPQETTQPPRNSLDISSSLILFSGLMIASIIAISLVFFRRYHR
ncbi:MAG: right-handed parallel beta-helix repeat-containing protein [Candidatus Bathyarchaeota archaeon]|nr:right-handed parallel beta-helix repeat-containing protein [Candidatus Bathyarchaeota archaeon]